MASELTLGQSGTSVGGIGANALAGAGAGSMFGPVGMGVGALLSILSGFLGAGDSPHDAAVQELLAKLDREMSYLKSTPYSKGEVEGKVSGVQDTLRGAANVAATQTGTAVSESLAAGGTPQGQPRGDIYTAALAPVIAEGEKGAAAAEQWGMQFWASLDDAAKNRLLAGLGLESNTINQLPNMTGTQKGVSSFLQTMNLLTTGFGNLAQGYKDFNYESIKV